MLFNPAEETRGVTPAWPEELILHRDQISILAYIPQQESTQEDIGGLLQFNPRNHPVLRLRDSWGQKRG